MLLSGLTRTYNEEVNLPKSLDNLFYFCDEVVISDGGSTDRTHDIVRAYQSAGYAITWLDFPCGSVSDKVFFNHAGMQLNFGLKHCKGDWVITNDIDIMHCDRLRANLRGTLKTTEHDSFLMYGVHFINDWGHFAGEMGAGPSMTQLFRNKDGVRFPNRAEHVAYVDRFPWENQGLLVGGAFHWGYVDRDEELAKIDLRTTAIPDDPTYAYLAGTPPEHVPTPIPWVLCHANCIRCWMEQIAVDNMVEGIVVTKANTIQMLEKQEDTLNAALILNDPKLIEMQTAIYDSMKIDLDSIERREKAIKNRIKEIDESLES